MTSLNDVFNQLRKLGEDLDENVDFASLLPEGHEHHRTALFIRLPYPGLLTTDSEVHERIAKLLASVNRPETIKMDVYTIVGNKVMQGWQPYTDESAKGMYDPVTAIESNPYVLQVIVDIVKPAALEATAAALDAE